MRYDKVIKNGMIVDGTRHQRYIGDIAIRDGVIAEIGHVDGRDASEIIDAQGLIVAPGFIDLHTHYDSQVYWDPYCTLSGWHGVTSVVIGNCGFGFAPMLPEHRERSMLSMTRIEAIPFESMKGGMPWDWVTFPEFLDSLDRTPKAVNLLPYVPVGPLLMWVLGLEDAKAGRKPTDAEHAELCRLLNEAMDAGGCGWSAQRMPPDGGQANQTDYDGTPMITDVMHDETCFEFAKVLASRNEGFIQMLYMCGDEERSERHFEKLAEIARRPILMNVLGSSDSDPEVHRKKLRWLESCRERGLLVVPQGNTIETGFTITFEEWNLWDDKPGWREATTGTLEERKRKLADPARRPALRDETMFLTGKLSDVVLIGPKLEKHQQFLDHSIALIAEKMGKHPVDALLDIATEEDLKTEFFVPATNRSIDNLRELVECPYVVLGPSDGGAHTRFVTGGRYPTESIILMVREHKMLTLEDMHWRLSALPGRVAGVSGTNNRGMLLKGAPADIVIYDFDNLEVLDDEILFDQPGNEWRRVQKASGYRYVLVNGEVTIKDDQQTNVYSGRLLRNHQVNAPVPELLAAE
jgi:N-acyl-D-amino-acid deacylase